MWEKFPIQDPVFCGLGERPVEFPEIELTYDTNSARAEAARCYRCDAETGSADYSVQHREDIFSMARTDPQRCAEAQGDARPAPAPAREPVSARAPRLPRRPRVPAREPVAARHRPLPRGLQDRLEAGRAPRSRHSLLRRGLRRGERGAEGGRRPWRRCRGRRLPGGDPPGSQRPVGNSASRDATPRVTTRPGWCTGSASRDADAFSRVTTRARLRLVLPGRLRAAPTSPSSATPSRPCDADRHRLVRWRALDTDAAIVSG